MANQTWKRIPLALKWLGGIVLVLLLLGVAISLIDWNAARGPISRYASKHLNRPVSIDGPLRVHLFSWTPNVSVEGLSVGNPEWAGGGQMLKVQRAYVAVELARLFEGRVVIPSLEIDQPVIALKRDESGRANWEFSSPDSKPKPSSSPTKVPPIRHFALKGGELDIDDAIQKLTFKGSVAANENRDARAHQDAEPFRLEGKGTLNKEPFQLVFEGGALLNIDLDKPYHFTVKVDAGPSNAQVEGSIAKPFDFGEVDADVHVKGQNLANLYYFTNLALPLTPPYQLAVKLHRSGSHFKLDNIAGQVGNSDMHGDASVDLASNGRPTLKATLVSKSLNLHDLGVAFGAGMSEQSAQQTDKPHGAAQLPAPTEKPASQYLLPDFQFQFDRLNSMDAVLDFRADSIQTQVVPFKSVAFKLKLDHGDLVIDPVDFEMPLGKLAGQIHLDTRGAMPQATIDVTLNDVHLEQIKGKAPDAQPALGGILDSRVQLSGHGNSVHAIAADSNGTMTVVIPEGQIRRAFAELTSINVLNGVGLLLSKSDQQANIRCGVAEFQVKDGDAEAARLIIDTDPVLITGDGRITLNDEKLDLNIAGKPKKIGFGRLRTPINIRGTLEHPSVGISTPALIKQGTIAAAAGVLLTPFAAALAFVDPGLAKNQNCANLIQETKSDQAQAEQGVDPHPTPPPQADKP